MKLEIDVPEGTTKIDIGPILVPIIRGVLNHGKSWGDTRVTQHAVEAFIKRAFTQHEFDNRIVSLREEWVKAYLDDTGWKQTSIKSNRTLYERPKIPPDPKPEWWHRQSWHDMQHHVAVPKNNAPINDRMLWLQKGLQEIAAYERRDIRNVLKSIEELAPVLDKLARL